MITDGLTALSVLLFLCLVLGVGTAVLLGTFSLLLKRGDAAALVALLTVAGLEAYAGLCVLAGVSSRDRVLGPGQEKHICEVDCHLAYSVVGSGARGQTYVVTVRVRFDEETISPQRGMGPLRPNSRYVAIQDSRGRRYEGSSAGLSRPLIPGESYTTDLVFPLPPDVHNLRLLLASDDLETRFLIGHENSFFHGKTTFRLNS